MIAAFLVLAVGGAGLAAFCWHAYRTARAEQFADDHHIPGWTPTRLDRLVVDQAGDDTIRIIPHQEHQ